MDSKVREIFISYLVEMRSQVCSSAHLLKTNFDPLLYDNSNSSFGKWLLENDKAKNYNIVMLFDPRDKLQLDLYSPLLEQMKNNDYFKWDFVENGDIFVLYR